MKAQTRTGVWTPVWIEKLNLSHSQTKLLAEIVSLHEKEGCFASNKYLSEILGLKTDTISRLISDLKKRGLLVQTGFDGRRRFLKPIYTSSLEKQASEKNPIHKVVGDETIQTTPIRKSNADTEFAAMPISTIDVQNNLYKNFDKKIERLKEKSWDNFLKWSRGRVTPTTWTIISQCTEPSMLTGKPSIYWNNWKVSSS